jgi:hypothetical protein
MSFLHAPTPLSFAISAGITLWDLWLAQDFGRRQIFAGYDTIRLPTGESLLEALARTGLVEVWRDDSGQIERVIRHADDVCITQKLFELIQQAFAARASAAV